MKNLISLLVLLATLESAALSQGCLPEVTWIYYQYQIDSFQVDNPGCTVIQGDVKIYGPLIKNLNGLTTLTGIEGDLKIVETDSLASLTGLDNITFIGGSLVIEENHLITNLTGLNSLNSIDENLSIDFNDQLASFSGLNNLDTIRGNFYVRGNNVLTNFIGLDELRTIQGHFYVGFDDEDEGNSNLTDFIGLSSLNYIGGELYIHNNNSLTGTTGLNNLTYFGGGLIISENEVFADLTSLVSLSPVNGGILIKSCPLLTSLTGLNNLTSIEGLMIEENPLLTSLSGLENLTYIRYWLSIYKDSSLTNIEALNKVTSVGYLNITNNPSLTSLSGLISLDSVRDRLDISSNDLLISLDGLHNLHYVSGSVWICSNDVLTSLVALDSLNSDSITWLNINHNPDLTTCSVPFVCNFLANPTGSINIYNNATGCNNPPEIARECGVTLPCLPFGDYYLFTQADIDNFQVNYPNCTEINGNLDISGSDITNLAGLNLVTSVTECLSIDGNEVLPNLNGLDNLESVGYLGIGSNGAHENLELTSLSGLESLVTVEGPVMIGPNPVLITLAGLQNLSSVEGLSIYNNQNLTDLSGLEGITVIPGDLRINDNNSLANLTGLINLISVGGSLTLGGNYSLPGLNGLDNLASLGGYLTITDNHALTSLAGLSNLSAIGGSISIDDNPVLGSLTGLENIAYSSISRINIYRNTLLSYCDVKSVCDFLACPHGWSTYIDSNATGCNSSEEIEAACLLAIDEKPAPGNHFTIYPNPSSTFITIETPVTTPKFLISIFNLNGQEVVSQQITEPNTEIDIRLLPQGIYVLKLTGDNAVNVLKLLKK